MAERSRPRKRTPASVAVISLCALVSLECASYAAGRVLQHQWCMFGVPTTPVGRIVPTYEEYLRRRDPILGWPFPDEVGSKTIDATGARPSPAFPDTTPETSQISLYGDSFTQSRNSDEDAWGNVLAVLSGRRVANYGMGGYGTDQAYLRFKNNGRDRSRIVVLSHVAEDILRNLTRNRDLIIYEMWYAYKPRFVLGPDGLLQLIPLPTLSEPEHLRLEGVESPQLQLDYESFYPGGPAGATALRFPFTWSILRNLGDFRMRAKLARRPYYAEFYEPTHPLRSLQITREICRAFAADAKARGQRPLVMLFPNREDLQRYRRSREWCYGPLVAELEAAGIELLEFGTVLAERAGARSLDEVYDGTGHFSRESDRWLAESVLAKLQTFPEWDALPRAAIK